MRKLTNALTMIAVLTATTALSANINGKIKHPNYCKSTHFKSIYLYLYGVRKAEKIEDIKDLKVELNKAKSTKVDLHRMRRDLFIIFNDTTDINSYENAIPSIMLVGNPVEDGAIESDVRGFVPTSEVSKVVDWIKHNKIDTEAGFLNLYQNASTAVKQELDVKGTPSKDELYKYYVKPLVNFYFAALKDQKSVVVIGE